MKTFPILTAEENDRIIFNLRFLRENPDANTTWTLRVLAEARAAGLLASVRIAFNPEDVERVQRCLTWIKANPYTNTDWALGVIQEARDIGLLPALKPALGCNCPKEPYFEPAYGGDLAEVF